MIKRFCRKQGCNALVESGYCEKHKQDDYKRYDQYRESAAKRGYGRKWKRERARFLAKNPLCVECQRGDKLIAATVVDHIIPHKGDQKLFWDRKNWQPLCKRHHDQKTVREDGGFGR